MLQFFRQIRKSLIPAHGTRKYILYAIGEIALVVIGILIALQINNWNEWRKDRIKEKEILTDLKLNLESNIILLDDRITYFNLGLSACGIVMHVLSNHLTYHDTLGVHFSMATRGYGGADVISYTGYESLKNNGFELIINKTLKDEILNLFETTYRELISIDETFKFSNSYRDEVVGPLFYNDKPHSLKPFDFEGIFNSRRYYSLVTDHQNNYRWMKDTTISGLSETQRVLQLINEELNED